MAAKPQSEPRRGALWAGERMPATELANAPRPRGHPVAALSGSMVYARILAIGGHLGKSPHFCAAHPTSDTTLGTELKWPTMPLWLSESDVRAALPMTELIGAMEAALIAFSAGRVVQPVRTVFGIRERCFFGLMPALDSDASILGAKLVTRFPENTAKGLDSHQAVIVLFDPASGALLAVTDGRYITEARTAAVSAVSVRHMARPDAKVLAILGSGVQARSHLEALPLVRDFGEVRAWSPNPARLREFVAARHVTACDSAEHAVRDADVVVLATWSIPPVIEDVWVAPGPHVIAVGACRYNHRETDPRLVAGALA